MRQLYKVLVVLSAHLAFLLPTRILANDERTYPMSYQQVDDAPRGRVHVVIDAPGSFGIVVIRLGIRSVL